MRGENTVVAKVTYRVLFFVDIEANKNYLCFQSESTDNFLSFQNKHIRDLLFSKNKQQSFVSFLKPNIAKRNRPINYYVLQEKMPKFFTFKANNSERTQLTEDLKIFCCVSLFFSIRVNFFTAFHRQSYIVLPYDTSTRE